MTWWLNASEEELQQARTCNQCGCGDSDIDLGLCFDCFSRLPLSEQLSMNAGVARKYGLHERAADFDRRAVGAANAEEPSEAEKDAFLSAIEQERQRKIDAHDVLLEALQEVSYEVRQYAPGFELLWAKVDAAIAKALGEAK